MDAPLLILILPLHYWIEQIVEEPWTVENQLKQKWRLHPCDTWHESLKQRFQRRYLSWTMVMIHDISDKWSCRGIPSVRTERQLLILQSDSTSFAHLGFQTTRPQGFLRPLASARMLPKQLRLGGQVSYVSQLSGCTRARSLPVVV